MAEIETAIAGMTQDERRAFFDRMPARQKREWELRQAWRDSLSPEHNAGLAARARKRMHRVDEMSPEMRAVVYDFGLEIVQVLIDHRLNSQKTRWLIDYVLNAERPHAKIVIGAAMSLGFTQAKAIFLIDTILGADYENGQPRFKINKAPNQKQNPLNREDDDEAYEILGAIVTAPAR